MANYTFAKTKPEEKRIFTLFCKFFITSNNFTAWFGAKPEVILTPTKRVLGHKATSGEQGKNISFPDWH